MSENTAELIQEYDHEISSRGIEWYRLGKVSGEFCDEIVRVISQDRELTQLYSALVEIWELESKLPIKKQKLKEALEDKFKTFVTNFPNRTAGFNEVFDKVVEYDKQEWQKTWDTNPDEDPDFKPLNKFLIVDLLKKYSRARGFQ